MIYQQMILSFFILFCAHICLFRIFQDQQQDSVVYSLTHEKITKDQYELDKILSETHRFLVNYLLANPFLQCSKAYILTLRRHYHIPPIFNSKNSSELPKSKIMNTKAFAKKNQSLLITNHDNRYINDLYSMAQMWITNLMT